MSGPAVIMAAPNGARRGKADHPALPVSAEEIAAEAARCLVAGAAVLHLHVRDEEGRHSLDPGRYRETMAEVAKLAPGMIVQVTTEAAGIYGPDEQIALVHALRPEAASVALREMTPDRAAESRAARFYARVLEEGTRIQHILYSPAEASRLVDLVRRGIVPGGSVSRIYVLGQYRPPEDGEPGEITGFLDAADGLAGDWTVCAFGGKENACAAEALRRGGHVRVGFENNLRLPDGRRAASSADLVALAAGEARATGRPPADPATARDLLGMRDSAG